jgi:hypothetical protein
MISASIFERGDLIQCMKDYATLSGKAFAEKWPAVVERQLHLARTSNAATWDVGARVFCDIAREIS